MAFRNENVRLRALLTRCRPFVLRSMRHMPVEPYEEMDALLADLDAVVKDKESLMQMTDAHRALLVRWEASFALPSLDNDDARAWTRRCAEQFAYSFPGEGWCHKSASPTRPPSTDVIARDFAGFWGYDLIVNQGRPDQRFEFNPQPMDIRGQTKIDVTPVNHLAVSPPEPPYPPNDLAARLAALEQRVRLIEAWISSY